MNHFSGIHGHVLFEHLDLLESDLKQLKSHSIRTIWLSGPSQALISHSAAIRQLIETLNLTLIIESDITTTNEIGAVALVTRDIEQLQALRTKHTTLKIGFITDQLADCKNAELFGADFIYLGPFDQIGLSPYQTISPKHDTYEWMILNCTTPIFAFGQSSDFDLIALTQSSKLSGIALPPNTLANQTNLRFTFEA